LTIKRNSRNRSILQFLNNIFILLIIAISFSSCEEDYYGRDGRDGNAYISLSWANEIPEYLDAGTGDIPKTFKWNQYYKIYPGFYVMYYEGSVWNGFGWTNYAYDVEYEVFVNEGESGQPYGIDGRDGADTYLTIECSPYGPYLFSNEKSGKVNKRYELIEKDENKIQVLQKSGKYSMKITYKKVDKRTSK
ncbi:MAG: hypothetical protein GXO79_06590, partial [Chlorobi bacterium]|nr:hypothetical protein [Chlorobiota bacterium]